MFKGLSLEVFKKEDNLKPETQDRPMHPTALLEQQDKQSSRAREKDGSILTDGHEVNGR